MKHIVDLDLHCFQDKIEILKNSAHICALKAVYIVLFHEKFSENQLLATALNESIMNANNTWSKLII